MCSILSVQSDTGALFVLLERTVLLILSTRPDHPLMEHDLYNTTVHIYIYWQYTVHILVMHVRHGNNMFLLNWKDNLLDQFFSLRPLKMHQLKRQTGISGFGKSKKMYRCMTQCVSYCILISKPNLRFNLSLGP